MGERIPPALGTPELQCFYSQDCARSRWSRVPGQRHLAANGLLRSGRCGSACSVRVRPGRRRSRHRGAHPPRRAGPGGTPVKAAVRHQRRRRTRHPHVRPQRPPLAAHRPPRSHRPPRRRHHRHALAEQAGRRPSHRRRASRHKSDHRWLLLWARGKARKRSDSLRPAPAPRMSMLCRSASNASRPSCHHIVCGQSSWRTWPWSLTSQLVPASIGS